MRKRLMVLALVGLAFVLLAGPVVAAGSGRDTTLAAKQGPRRRAHVISMTGIIKGFEGKDISVYVQMTNKPFLVKRGQTVLVETSPSTIYYVWNSTGRHRASFDDLEKDQKVSINALVADAEITARRVEVNRPRYR
jgi:hypothetical protein